MLKQYFLLIAVLLAGSQLVLADLAPPAGYVQVATSAILTTDDDLSDYRFFLVSSNLVKEVLVVKGQKAVVSALGGGARYGGGSVYAVPKGAVSKYSGELSSEQMETLSIALHEKMPGSIELVKHSFSDTVLKKDAKGVTDSAYKLSKTADGIKVEPISSSKPATKSGSAIEPKRTEMDLSLMIGSGLLLAGLAVGAGVWMTRSRRKGNDEN